MQRIRSGDEVIVITGRKKELGGNRGKRGVVLKRVDAERLLVEGVNVVKKHQKPNQQRNEVGGIVDKTMPIHQSNIAIFNPTTGKGDRVGFKILEDGTKVRVFKSNGEQIGQKGE